MATKSKRLTEEERLAAETAKLVRKLQADKERAEKKTRLLLAVAERKIARAKATLERKLERERLKEEARAKREAGKTINIFRRAMCPWTPEQAAVFDDRPFPDIGPGEFSVALLKGKELVVKQRKGKHRNDQLDSTEVKCIGGTGAQRNSLIAFRAGSPASTRWARCLWDIAAQVSLSPHLYVDRDLREELLMGLPVGWQRKLPPGIVNLVRRHLEPSEGLAEYFNGMYLVTREGWIFVDPSDYDDAFEIYCTTKGDVKYRLRCDWLLGIPPWTSSSPPDAQCNDPAAQDMMVP